MDKETINHNRKEKGHSNSIGKKQKTKPIGIEEDNEEINLNDCDFVDSDHDIPDLVFENHAEEIEEEIGDYIGLNESLYRVDDDEEHGNEHAHGPNVEEELVG